MPNDEYIKRSDALFELYRYASAKDPALMIAYRVDLCERIEAIPAADVVSVVRCKDCRHTKTDGIDAIYCQKWDRWEMPPNAYCYLGEKRKAEPPKEEDNA